MSNCASFLIMKAVFQNEFVLPFSVILTITNVSRLLSVASMSKLKGAPDSSLANSLIKAAKLSFIL